MLDVAENLGVDPDLSLIDAVYARRSVRGYLDKEVPQNVLNRIFEIAQQSPLIAMCSPGRCTWLQVN